MALNSHQLQRYVPQSRAPAQQPALERPPADLDILLIGAGNSAEALALRCQALGYSDHVWFNAVGLNNDQLAPRPLLVRRPDGADMPIELTERLVLDGASPRDQLADHPLLERRYARLLRGIPVFETYPRAGAGGHGHPVISALDIDLEIDRVLALLRQALRRLHAPVATAAGLSELQQLVAQQRRQAEVARAKRIIVIGGGCGAMGNAAHQLIPYLLRWLLAEQRINAELWGVVLGPRAFTGLTPFVRQNYRALLDALEYLNRHGQRRAYINDFEIALQQPPYDRVFLLDDPSLPGTGTAVTEPELEGFLDQAALDLYLLLRGTVWQTIASHTANDDGVVRADGRLRYLHTARGAVVQADRAQIAALLAADLADRALEQLLERFAA